MGFFFTFIVHTCMCAINTSIIFIYFVKVLYFSSFVKEIYNWKYKCSMSNLLQIYPLLIYFSLFGMILIYFSFLVWLLRLSCLQRNGEKFYFFFNCSISLHLETSFSQAEAKNFISHQLLQLGCIENFKPLHLLRVKKVILFS